MRAEIGISPGHYRCDTKHQINKNYENKNHQSQPSISEKIFMNQIHNEE